ncbi:unnamed protein product [marine sediment metagenome]|uniref:Uncharacterized protein n=1 Tax=marine sediment metagenome TaxID=412755 RepID=X0UGZ4_9ZZZZ
MYITIFTPYKKIHQKRCNPYKQRLYSIYEDAPKSLVWQNFEVSLMIIRVEVKDPP